MPSTDATIEIGSEFLGYRIETELGRGGMGVVWLAYDLRLKRRVALKFVAPALAADGRFRDRFLRETELAAALEHPNVVPVHAAGEQDGQLYLAMRYVEGTDLGALLRSDGAVAPARAVAICAQVAAALDAAHARGLVHRDVKPSNVLLDADEHVYLGDFGLTRRLHEQGPALDGHSVGTPAYLAPEQLDGGPVDGRADVYGLACLLFTCLTGGPPYPGTSRFEVAWAHLEQEPPRASARNSELPTALDGVFRRALAKGPAERFSTCAQLIAATEGALGLQPRRRRRGLVLAWVAAALGAAALAVLLLDDGGGRAAAPVARADTLVRINPWRNVITDVIGLDGSPAATAVKGRNAWVYEDDVQALAQVDVRSRARLRTTLIRGRPVELSTVAGPVLDADQAGAWIVTTVGSRGLLTRVLPGGGKREYALPGEPKAVGVGDGAVWVLVRNGGGSRILRVDPETGHVARAVSLGPSSRADSMRVGVGAVWAVSSATAILYRVDAESGAVHREDLGQRGARPDFVLTPTNVLPGSHRSQGLEPAVWVGISDFGGSTAVVDRMGRAATLFPCCPIEQGTGVNIRGWPWTYDPATGMLVHWRRGGPGIVARVRVTDSPYWGGLCMTSLAVGAGAIWVTVAGPSSIGSYGSPTGLTPAEAGCTTSS